MLLDVFSTKRLIIYSVSISFHLSNFDSKDNVFRLESLSDNFIYK